MTDREKVIRGLIAHCETWDEGKLGDCITNPDMCPYRRGDKAGCTAALAADALALLKEQEKQLKEWEKHVPFHAAHGILKGDEDNA